MGSFPATRHGTKVFTSSVIVIATFVCGAVNGESAKNAATPIQTGPPGLAINLEGHTGVSQFVAFLPDGQRLVSSARDGIRFWDVASGTTKFQSKPSGIAAVCADGSGIAIVWGASLYLIDARTGETLREFLPKPLRPIRSIAFAPDGSAVATAGDKGVVQIWNPETGKLVRELSGHTRSVRALAFSPDSSMLISGGQDRTIRFWEVRTGRTSRPPIQSGFDSWSLQFSPDARYVLSAGRHEDVVLWDAENGTEVRRLKGHIAFVHRAIFAPGGRHVLTASDDRTVRYWDMQTGGELARFSDHNCNILDVTVSPDGQFAASVGGGVTVDGRWAPGDDFGVRVWRLPLVSAEAKQSGLNIAALESGPVGEYASFSYPKFKLQALALTTDGKLLATTDKAGVVRVAETVGNRTVATFAIDKELFGTLAFSPGGRRLVGGSRAKALRLWDVASKQLIKKQTAAGPVYCAEFFPDGRRVLLGTHGAVVIWDTETEELTELGLTGIRANAVAVSADGGTLAAACRDSIVRVWDGSTKELLYELAGHTDDVLSCSFNPTGDHLVSGSRDHAVKLWDLKTGELIRTIDGHIDAVFRTNFLADGRRILSGPNWKDGVLRMWDAQNGTELWSYPLDDEPVLSLDTTADGRFAAVRTDKSVRILRLPGIQNTSALEAYELARKLQGPSYSIAVLDFVNAGPSVELSPLRNALAEMLTARLGQYGRVDAVERRAVNQFLRETTLSSTGLIDQATVQQAGKTLTADYLLSGTFSRDNGKITVQATLLKTGEEKSAGEWTVSAASDDLFEIERQLATRTLEAFGITKPELDTLPPRKAGSELTVAFAPFRNLGSTAGEKSSAEPGLSYETRNDLQNGIPEILQSTLSVIPEIKLVERDELNSVLTEQRLTMAGMTDPKTAARVGKIAGADRFIYGSFLQTGDKLTVIARLADTETSQILGTEIADGVSGDVGSLFEHLAQRLAIHLNAGKAETTANLLKQAAPVRKLEAATHGARAMAMLEKGDYEAAFGSFDRVLLVEPENVDQRAKYVRALYRHDRYEKAIEVAESTLTLKFPASKQRLKDSIYSYYLHSLNYSGQNEKRLEVARQWAKESRPRTYAQKMARAEQARALRRGDRRDEAIAMLEADAMKVEAQGNPIAYGNELTWIYSFYRGERYSYGSRDPNAEKDSAERAMEIAETLLKLAEGREGRSVSVWGDVLVPHAAKIRYRKAGSNTSTYYLNSDERIDLLNRARGVFAWHSGVQSDAAFELARLHYGNDACAQALGAFRDYLSTKHFEPGAVVSRFDREFISPYDWIDHQVEAQFRVGQLLQNELNKPEEAIAEYQKYVREFGLTNSHGPHVLKGLSELGAEPDFAERNALIWGGATETLKSWQSVLEPRGFKTHLVRRYHLTASDLSPYDLVILVRSGDIPFEPIDILALRSYVATGGSLAVVVSPAWEASAPLIHSGLLSLFDVRPGIKTLDPAPATKINAEHPITLRIPALTARHAVPLEVPFGTSLVESNGQTILAAIPHRHGRVVVSSFGQWLFPDPAKVYGARWQRDVVVNSAESRTIQSTPLQPFTGTNATLVKQTIDWLTEARPNDEVVRQQRDEFAAAWLAALKYEAQAIPRVDMTETLDRLVDNTSAEWKEEALWLAGEAHLRMQFFDQRSMLRWPSFGFRKGEPMPLPRSSYYEQLVTQFPDSPLKGFAQWRVTECGYRPTTYYGTKQLAVLDEGARQSLIEQYEKVLAPTGTLPWALAQARLGRIRYCIGDFAGAATHFRAISENMPPGVERISALLDLSLSLSRLDENEKAQVALNVVKSMPNVELLSSSHGRYGTLIKDEGDSQEVAEDFARRLASQ